MRKGEPGSSPSFRYGATPASNYSSLTGEQLEIGSEKTRKASIMKSACRSECCVIEGSVSQSPNYSLQKHLQKLLRRKSLYCIFKKIAVRLKARWETDYTNFLLFIMCF